MARMKFRQRSVTRIADLHHRPSVGLQPGGGVDLVSAGVASLQRLGRVEQQVEEHLLEQVRAAAHERDGVELRHPAGPAADFVHGQA